MTPSTESLTITATIAPTATEADRAKLRRAVETVADALRRMVADYAIPADVELAHATEPAGR